MYEAFFGLRETPFNKTPDPRFLYLGKNHGEAFARLIFAVEKQEMILLTGPVGSGKTTLSRALMDELGETYPCFFLVNPRLSPLEFLRTVALRLQIADPPRSKADVLEKIEEALFNFYRQGLRPVLIIDEVQLISNKDTFEEIRLLTNFQLDDRNLLCIILLGLPEVRRRIKHSSFASLRQRIGLNYSLEALSVDETEAYLEHRWRVAGGGRSVFATPAVAEIHRLSGGLPRLINQVATMTLLEAFGRDCHTLTSAIVTAVEPELALVD